MKKLLSLLAITIFTFNVNSQTIIENNTNFSGYVFNYATTSTNIITTLTPSPTFSCSINSGGINLIVLEKNYNGTGFDGNYNSVNIAFNIARTANSGTDLIGSNIMVFVELLNGNIRNTIDSVTYIESTPVTTSNYNINMTFTNNPSFNKIVIYVKKLNAGTKTKYKAVLNNLTITGTGHTVGINELANVKNGQNLKLYPNPSNGDFKLSFNTNKEKTNINVFNIQGQLVYEDKLETTIGTNETTLNLENMASGIYIVRVEDFTQKVTIIK